MVIICEKLCSLRQKGQIIKTSYSKGRAFLTNKDIRDIIILSYITKTKDFDLKFTIEKYELFLLLQRALKATQDHLDYVKNSAQEKFNELKVNLNNDKIVEIFFSPDIFFQYYSSVLTDIFSIESQFFQNFKEKEFLDLHSCDYIIFKYKNKEYYLDSSFLTPNQYKIFNAAKKNNIIKIKDQKGFTKAEVIQRGKKPLNEIRYEGMIIYITNASKEEVMDYIVPDALPLTIIQNLKKHFKKVDFHMRVVSETSTSDSDKSILRILKQYKIYFEESKDKETQKLTVVISVGVFEGEQQYHSEESHDFKKILKFFCAKLLR